MEGKFLPVGTVCRLKGATACLMIIGFCVNKEGDDSKIYDYLGCMYPQGMIAQDTNFLFDHAQIEEIIYMGLINDQERDFKAKLNDYLTSNNVYEKFHSNNDVNQTQAYAAPQANSQPQMFINNNN